MALLLKTGHAFETEDSESDKIVKFVVLRKHEEDRAKQEDLPSFEAMMLPHLDAAHNLARWLVRNEEDAQDVVQEAYLRAFKSFGGFHGSNGRAWLLTIVRNTSYTLLRKIGPLISPRLLMKNYMLLATSLLVQQRFWNGVKMPP